MAFEPYTIDDSVKSKASDMIVNRIPEGDYLAEITSCVPSTEAQPAAYSWRMKIVQGAAGIGQTISYYCSMKDPNELLGKKSTFFNLGNLISAALSPEAAEKFQAALAPDPETGTPRMAIQSHADHVKLGAKLVEKLKGQQIYILVGDNTNNGRTFSNVTRVGPASMYAGPGLHSTVPANGADVAPPANVTSATEATKSAVDEVFAGLQAV